MKNLSSIVKRALAEDQANGDITTDLTIPPSLNVSAAIIAKEPGVLCAMAFVSEVFHQLDPKMRVDVLLKDGQKLTPGKPIAHLYGKARAILSGERVALNFLSWGSAIATRTREFVDKVKDHQTVILDTRKTTPLFREFERYAVRCGGAQNHRFNLNDMVLIKDNHLMVLKGKPLSEIINAIKIKSRRTVEVEVDTLTQFQEVIDSSADIILLDNMSVAQIRRAVAIRDKRKSKVLLEASGGISIHNVASYAAAGVDRISIGALTHSRKAIDFSLEIYE